MKLSTPSQTLLLVTLAACSLFACRQPAAPTDARAIGAADAAEQSLHGDSSRDPSSAQGTEPRPGLNDLNGNGIDDAIDIVDGWSLDVDMNGIPDEAETW